MRVHAGYLTLENRSDRERELESITSPVFERVEMHRTVIADDGTSSMQQLKGVAIAAGDGIEFKPGGMHLMLFDTREPIRTGMRIPLTLRFSDGTTLDSEAEVRRRNSTHEHH